MTIFDRCSLFIVEKLNLFSSLRKWLFGVSFVKLSHPRLLFSTFCCSFRLDDDLIDTASMGTFGPPLVGVSGELQDTPPYSVENHIRFHFPKNKGRLFAIKT